MKRSENMRSIQYPSGSVSSSSNVSITKKQKTGYASRGMFLETLINQSNDYYLSKQVAVIHKKPTPIQVVTVHYPKRSAAVITEAYYKNASTTDYNGVYRGQYIDFEAKETKNKASFPLKNIHDHQLEHMKCCLQQKGIVFIILYFSSLNEFYLLESSYLISYIEANKGKTSLPLSYIQKFGYSIQVTIQSILDYIPVVDQVIDQQQIIKE